LAEQLALERTISRVETPDSWYLKRGTRASALRSTLQQAAFTNARRAGKLLLLDVGHPAHTVVGSGHPAHTVVDSGHPAHTVVGSGHPAPTVVGIRFGMTGRLVIDGVSGVDQLVYAPALDSPRSMRFGVRFSDGGRLEVWDPRRLGGVEMNPDESRLGPDALRVTPTQLRAVLASSSAPLKARLLDQARLAGVGNLTADEVLWRAGLDPARPASSLSAVEIRRLHRHLTVTLADLISGGGSHTGRLMASRVAGGRCPRDGTPLSHRRVGGRTTWSCPAHQR